MNMMCSNRWAKPVRPGCSSDEPTWYQILTATSGTEWSSCTITWSPFGSVKVSNGTRRDWADSRTAGLADSNPSSTAKAGMRNVTGPLA